MLGLTVRPRPICRSGFVPYCASVPFGDDQRPTWQRLYGLGLKWNERAVDNFGRFAVAAVLIVLGLFVLLCAAAWYVT